VGLHGAPTNHFRTPERLHARWQATGLRTTCRARAASRPALTAGARQMPGALLVRESVEAGVQGPRRGACWQRGFASWLGEIESYEAPREKTGRGGGGARAARRRRRRRPGMPFPPGRGG